MRELRAAVVSDELLWTGSLGVHGQLSMLAERLGSGDGEGWTLLTRQIASEPLPASVLFGVGGCSTFIVDSYHVVFIKLYTESRIVHSESANSTNSE